MEDANVRNTYTCVSFYNQIFSKQESEQASTEAPELKNRWILLKLRAMLWLKPRRLWPVRFCTYFGPLTRFFIDHSSILPYLSSDPGVDDQHVQGYDGKGCLVSSR